MHAIYQGPRSRDGKSISAGLEPGGEMVEWSSWLVGSHAIGRMLNSEFFKWMIYRDQTWSSARFDVDRDFAMANQRVGGLLNSDNPDIRPFLSRGGKVLLYHGWSDGALPPGNTITYYEAVKHKAAARAAQVRLFMVPGMGHCLGGNGASNFDTLAALDSWLEGGPAPDRIIAAKVDNPMGGVVGAPVKTLQTRPLCAWPRQARWKGTGSTDEAANFSCEMPPSRGS